jgi:hypothetical protein
VPMDGLSGETTEREKAMITLTEQVLTFGTAADDGYRAGFEAFHSGKFGRIERDMHKDLFAEVREAHGFVRVATQVHTEPAANLKLLKGVLPSYGITLQHYVSAFSRRITVAADGQLVLQRLVVNACPNAGDCTKVCVLDNGNGRYDKVQQARRAKTEFLARHPFSFGFLVGWENAKAVKKHGGSGDVFAMERCMLDRPDVNSDVRWDLVMPSMVDGSVTGAAIGFYGYSKLDERLDGDGWLTPYYRVAFSCNEDVPITDLRVEALLDRGGSAAVVTDRITGEPVRQWHPRYKVVDADLTDEWMFESGVIGDLSAKGKARKLIGKSGFVYSAYSEVLVG